MVVLAVADQAGHWQLELMEMHRCKGVAPAEPFRLTSCSLSKVTGETMSLTFKKKVCEARWTSPRHGWN